MVISQLKAYAISELNKALNHVDAARRQRKSLVLHVEETLAAEYARAMAYPE